MPPRRRLRALLALTACLTAAGVPDARLAGADEPNSANVVAARRHFDRARANYGRGAYREAIAELEAAHALDPTAKDLVFNLGVVHERLGDIDDALLWFHLYTTMDLTAPERERADGYTRRLEGAKRELAQKAAGAGAGGSGPAPGPRIASSAAPVGDLQGPSPTDPTHGRMDGATITAIAFGGAALAFATVMAVKAEVDRPPGNFVTGRDGSYADLSDRTDVAHREAIAADIGFGVGGAAAMAAAILYFGRTRDAADSRNIDGAHAGAHVSVLPLLPAGGGGGGGGQLFVQGSF